MVKNTVLFVLFSLCAQAQISDESRELGEAILREDFKTAKKLVKKVEDINAPTNGSGEAALHHAMTVASRDHNPFQEFSKELAGLLDRDGRFNGFVRFLLEHGADPDVQNRDGETPLHYIAKKYQKQFINTPMRLLLEYGADPNIPNGNGETILHYPTFVKYPWREGLASVIGSAALLIKKGADPNAQDNQGNTPLHRYALAHSQLEYPDMDWLSIDVLLKHGADPNIPNENGDRPLHLFAQLEHRFRLRYIETLIEYRADPALPNNNGELPFRSCPTCGHKIEVADGERFFDKTTGCYD